VDNDLASHVIWQIVPSENENKHQSNFAMGEITSLLFTKWQQQLAIAFFRYEV